MVPFVSRPQRDRAVGRLSEGEPHFRRFQAVIDRIPHEVQQRVGHHFQHGLVEPGSLAVEDEFGLLFRGDGRGANGPFELRGDGRQRHHPQPHQFVFDFAGEPHLPGELPFDLAEKVAEFAEDRLHVVGGFGQFAREKVELGVAVEFERVEAVAASRECGCPGGNAFADEGARLVAGFQLAGDASSGGARFPQ